MKIYITKADVRGVEKEMIRLMKPDREYLVEWKETSRSRKRMAKLKIKQNSLK